MSTTDYRLRESANEEYVYVPDRIPDLPTDDTEPDEHGNEPRTCVRCEREPAIGNPVMTTNRGLDEVNGRVWIDPVCDGHANNDTRWVAWRLLAYSDVDHLADAISLGVVSQGEAFEAIGVGPEDGDDYFFVPDEYEHDSESIRADFVAELEDRNIVPCPP